MKNGKELYYPKGGRGFKGGPVVPPNSWTFFFYAGYITKTVI
jgi:hypothetical protein